MDIDLPFEPLDAFESFQALLPDFAFEVPTTDLQDFIINGYITRRFLLRGRLKGFGHTRLMRSSEELSVKAFLSDPIPKDDPKPLYKGDAIGCEWYNLSRTKLNFDGPDLDLVVIEGQSQIYTRSDDLYLTTIRNNETLKFVYQRPSILHPYTLAEDLILGTLYQEYLQAPHEILYKDQSAEKTSKTIFQYLNTKPTSLSLFEESFQRATKEQSKLGFSKARLRAMKALSVMHRISKEYEEAERLLFDTLRLLSDFKVYDFDLECDLTLNLGRLYLDEQRFDMAEEQFSRVSRRTKGSEFSKYNPLYLVALEGLSATYFQRGNLEAAEFLMTDVVESRKTYGGPSGHQYLAKLNILGMMYRAWGKLDLASQTCGMILKFQEGDVSVAQHEMLRTIHNLAGVLADQGSFSEAETLYLREIDSLKELLGPENTDTVSALRSLARTYFEASQVEKAVDAWRRVVEAGGRSSNTKVLPLMQDRLQLVHALVRLREYKDSIQLVEDQLLQSEQI